MPEASVTVATRPNWIVGTRFALAGAGRAGDQSVEGVVGVIDDGAVGANALTEKNELLVGERLGAAVGVGDANRLQRVVGFDFEGLA